MSSFDHVTTGSIILYPYLWAREAADGETSGRKPRPAVVVVRKPGAHGDLIALLAITSQPPSKAREAVEIPETERLRSGLSTDLRLWIMLDEYNIDVIGHSFYLEPRPPIGRLSRAFFLPVLERFVSGSARRTPVKRT